MKKLKFKKGDFCFCNFRLSEILETKGNRITYIDNTYGGTSYYDLSKECFPIDLNIKRISDFVLYWSDKIKKDAFLTQNYGDISLYIIDLWVEMCENKDDKEALTTLSDKFKALCTSICKGEVFVFDKEVRKVK